jgi:lysophospholipase L1-like esterase
MRIGFWTCLTLLLTACAKPQPIPENHSIRYLALGDSYTSGESVDESSRWPVQLAGALRNAGFDVGDPIIIAETGWTTGDLTDAIEQSDPQPPFGLVTLLIGVNNQYQGRSEDEYRTQFVALLNRSIELAGGKPGHVVVLSIPDWGVTPFAQRMGASPTAVAAAIDRFNAINQAETKKAGARYVDITPVSRSHPDLIAGDGLHPSREMYARWVESALPVAEAALGH